jgi:D-alanyl-D-alanine carboxypeptidase
MPENEQNLILPEVAESVAETKVIRQTATSSIPVMPQFFVAVSILLIVFGVTYWGEDTAESAQDDGTSVRVEKTLPVDSSFRTEDRTAFADVSLEAKSAIVWDVREGRVLFNKNADDVRPLASIAKLMTALVVYELLDPEDLVTITREAIAVEGDSGFTEGETFTMQNLADLMLIESSNDGATALASRAGNAAFPTEEGMAVFVSAMNIKSKELGLTRTNFKNSTGLDLSETEAGAEGSARDVAHLMEYLIREYPDAAALTTLGATTIQDTKGTYHLVQNTNERVAGIDGLIASKTGYTVLSGGNLVIAVNAGLNRPIIIAVLGSSTAGRFTDVHTLLAETRAALAQES